MLSPPGDLAISTLTRALTRRWGLAVASIDYRAVGFGSHHWVLTDPAGGRWFVTVDDLRKGPSTDEAYDRLDRALSTARALRDCGERFVVAPVPTAGGDPVVRLGDGYAASLFPLIEGDTYDFGEYSDRDHRDAVLAMVVRVHSAPEAARRRATVDDLAIAQREALDAALGGAPVEDCGPYAARAARLIGEHATAIRAALARYDELVAGADPRRSVLTHGEPHPGNTLRTPDGWRLIDWDTARIAPPERDLCLLGGELTAYTDATGVEVRPEMLALFRLRWELADLAIDSDRFRRPHADGPDDQKAWRILQSVVGDFRT